MYKKKVTLDINHNSSAINYLTKVKYILHPISALANILPGKCKLFRYFEQKGIWRKGGDFNRRVVSPYLIPNLCYLRSPSRIPGHQKIFCVHLCIIQSTCILGNKNPVTWAELQKARYSLKPKPDLSSLLQIFSQRPQISSSYLTQ